MTYNLQLYGILRRILSEINSQVVDHGDRVAYLYLKMGEFRQLPDDIAFEHMMLACYAHDIGAYKTEKFLDLLRFDVTHTLEHCIYGYLFMKYFSPLMDDAEVLIYHHTFYNERDKFSSPFLDEGILIHFLDRIDILSIGESDDNEIYRRLKDLSGLNFNPSDVDDFIAADRKYHLLEKLRDGSYSRDVESYFNKAEHCERLIRPIINMLAYEIDFKSEQTVIHSITTTLLAQDLAVKMNLPEKSCEELEYAARLHDLGKIDIAGGILEKPGRLTADEYCIMKKHVTFTKEIIKDLFPDNIVSIAYRHHERLDGSGYPEGLSAESLSLQDRILQVADVTSALLQKRSYKEALDKEVVIKILTEESQAGRLDKNVIDELISDYDSIIGDLWTRSSHIISLYENLQTEFGRYLNEFSSADHDGSEEFGLFSGMIQKS